MKKFILGLLMWTFLLAMTEVPLKYIYSEINTLNIMVINAYAIISILCFGVARAFIKVLFFRKHKTETKKSFLKYSFINNSILLTTETINKNGFFEVWRQENKERSIQILCFNPDTKEFQAFDRFHWMDEPRVVINPPSYFRDTDGVLVHCDPLEPNGVYYNEDLWTPIKLHYTVEWLQKHIKNTEL